MKTTLKFTVLLFTVLILSACGGNKVTLDPALIVSMNTQADLYDAQYPDTAEINVARACVAEPLGLYWHESGLWAVVCELPALPKTYGAVLMDASYTVFKTTYVSAESIAALEEMVFSTGWEAR